MVRNVPPDWRRVGEVCATIPERHTMSFDLEKILESKRALRRHLASRPIAEKLATLDALRERALTLTRRCEARNGC